MKIPELVLNDMLGKTKYSEIKKAIFRLFTYSYTIFFATQVMIWDAYAYGGAYGKFGEDSYTETMQNIFLMAISVIYLIACYRNTAFRTLSFALFSFSLASLVREQDALLDTHLFDGAWQCIVFLIVGATVIYLFRNFKAFIQDLEQFLPTYTSALFLFGTITTYFFSRMYGRSIFWKGVMEEHYIRSVKNASEECLELYGYTILLICAIEFAFVFLPAKRAARQTELNLCPETGNG
ncbi:MAG: hypothetical protein INR69_07685 [Mucilaginibacter polytrichastri]|nr:hypothetical protein [Mucilaginibacter polytrichastri]